MFLRRSLNAIKHMCKGKPWRVLEKISTLRVVFSLTPLHIPHPQSLLRSSRCSSCRVCLFYCMTLTRSSLVALSAPLESPLRYSLRSYNFYKGVQTPLSVCARLRVARAARLVTLFVDTPSLIYYLSGSLLLSYILYLSANLDSCLLYLSRFL